MKLSSFYQQMGGTVNFITCEAHLKMSYDELHIFKENKNTEYPQRKILDKENVALHGDG